MFAAAPLSRGTKPEAYGELVGMVRALLEGERDPIANTANVSALLYESLPDLNWAGFYFLKGGELVLGPFQGKPACVRIALGNGVCGTSAQARRTVVVQDVHQFAGHIACDSASNSEVVVPIIAGSRLVGVLDLDSPSKSRFDDEDARGLEAVVAELVRATDFA